MRQYVRSSSPLSLRSPYRGVETRAKRAADTPPILRDSLQTGGLNELDKARAELAAVRAEAQAARASADHLRAKLRQSSRDAQFRLRATAAIMVSAALLKLAWEATHPPLREVAPGALRALPPIAQEDANPADHSEGTRALERLRRAFHTFPGLDQMTVVRQVNERRWGPEMNCPLVWNDAGIPALYVGDQKGEMPPPLVAKALNQCASGVERLRSETDPAAK